MKSVFIFSIFVSLAQIQPAFGSQVGDGRYQVKLSISGELLQIGDNHFMSVEEQADRAMADACTQACGECDPGNSGACVVVEKRSTLGVSGYLAAPADMTCTVLKRLGSAGESASITSCRPQAPVQSSYHSPQ